MKKRIIKTKKGNRILIMRILRKFAYFLITAEGNRQIEKRDIYKYY